VLRLSLKRERIRSEEGERRERGRGEKMVNV
jgi:hypothetical protein